MSLLARKKKLLMRRAGVVPTTLNPSDNSGTVALSSGDLEVLFGANNQWIRSVVAKTSGKYYFEVAINQQVNGQIGLANASLAPNGSPPSYLGKGTNSFALFGNGFFCINDNFVNTTMSSVNGNVVCVAVDIDAKLVWYRINNGDWNITGDAAAGIGGIDFSALTGSARYVALGGDSGGRMTVNFGATSFAYSPPAGFGIWG